MPAYSPMISWKCSGAQSHLSGLWGEQQVPRRRSAWGPPSRLRVVKTPCPHVPPLLPAPSLCSWNPALPLFSPGPLHCLPIPPPFPFPGMRILVNLLLDTLPMLGNVLLLCFFVFFIFGIIGVQLWAGLLRNRCFLDENFTM